ncbi:MAG: roadblock/LC7 domain-containing protein [Candidatus Thermoplasmatota archaeon]|nr:roadblock/LC7 domain-containing protein [Candidatus Thermoplasmatota archaeon]MBU4190336.1 roadblock/LC7 domain-containing protein [Candidatus Thermoplasmatota archaeon]MBU4256613.1 roadblock/LC7 domain-containing protein [Candidatus Thermoplasmatota archaeon]MCG2827416.1 roadblock/LC7 domain-containing protein [Thermoplasmatales archaeon]
METKSEKLLSELKKLANVGSIEGSAVVARNGLIIVSDLPRDVDERRLGAMSATMMGAVETAAITLNKGQIKRVTAEIEKAILVAMGAGKKAILVVSASPDANLGMLMVEMEERVKSIMEILGV